MKQTIKSLTEAIPGAAAPGGTGTGLVKDVNSALDKALELVKTVSRMKDTFGKVQGLLPGQKTEPATQEPPTLSARHHNPDPVQTARPDGMTQFLGLVKALGLGDVPLNDIWSRVKSQSVNEILGKK